MEKKKKSQTSVLCCHFVIDRTLDLIKLCLNNRKILIKLFSQWF